jgi:hypothetical protein
MGESDDDESKACLEQQNRPRTTKKTDVHLERLPSGIMVIICPTPVSGQGSPPSFFPGPFTVVIAASRSASSARFRRPSGILVRISCRVERGRGCFHRGQRSQSSRTQHPTPSLATTPDSRDLALPEQISPQTLGELRSQHLSSGSSGSGRCSRCRKVIRMRKRNWSGRNGSEARSWPSSR